MIAERLVSAIRAACAPLCTFPHGGDARPQLAPGLHVTFHAPYAIYYLLTPEAVIVIRVLLGAQDATALAAGGAFDT